MTARLFEEVLERLYREYRLASGTLQVGDRRVGLYGLRAPAQAVVTFPRRRAFRLCLRRPRPHAAGSAAARAAL